MSECFLSLRSCDNYLFPGENIVSAPLESGLVTMKNLRYSLHQSLLSSAFPLGLSLTSSPIADINMQGVTVWVQVAPCMAGDVLLPVSITLLTSDPLGGGVTTQFVCGPGMRLSSAVTNSMWALSITALVCSALTAVLLFMKKQV